jgi:hypothetical protein
MAAPVITPIMDSPTQPAFEDPYRPPTAPVKPGASPGSLQYTRAWKYPFESPQWVVTVLFLTAALVLSGFIPILPFLIVYGYQFEVIEGLHRSGGRSYPEFNIDRFAEYLVRGVWVMLVAMLGALALTPVILIILGGGVGLMIAVAAAAGSEDAAAVVFGAGLPVLVLLIVLVGAALNVFLFPLLLRAGLTQDFGAAFSFDWIKSFISKTWKEMILGTLFLAATGTLAIIAGTLLCCIGTYPAMALTALAQSHMFYQFYDLFLARGGEPILLKDPAQKGW